MPTYSASVKYIVVVPTYYASDKYIAVFPIYYASVKYTHVGPNYHASVKFLFVVPTYYARVGTTCKPSLPPVCRTRPGSPPLSASPQSGSPIQTGIRLVVHYHRTV